MSNQHHQPRHIEGWLEKQSEWRKKWRPRYFILRGKTLSYYEDTDQPEKGAVVLSSSNFPSSENASAAGFTFTITGSSDSNDSWNLRAGGANDFEKWKHGVQNALELHIITTAAASSSSSSRTQNEKGVTSLNPQSFVPEKDKSSSVEDNLPENCWLVHKRSEWLGQWRQRICFLPSEFPGILHYAATPSTISRDSILTALKKPEKLVLLSCDIIQYCETGIYAETKPYYLACRVMTKSGEEFPLRFQSYQLSKQFFNECWKSLKTAGLVNRFQALSSPLALSSVRPELSNVRSGENTNNDNSETNNNTSSNNNTSFAENVSFAGLISKIEEKTSTFGASSSTYDPAPDMGNLCLAASGASSGIISDFPDAPICVLFGGIDRGGGIKHAGDLFVGNRDSTTAQAFTSNSEVCLVNLSGNFVHQICRVPGVVVEEEEKQGNQATNENENETEETLSFESNNIPQSREGAASCTLQVSSEFTVANTSNSIFLIHGGTFGFKVLGDIWILDSFTSLEHHQSQQVQQLRWRKPKIVFEKKEKEEEEDEDEEEQECIENNKLPNRVGHSMLPIPGTNSVLMIGGYNKLGQLCDSIFLLDFEKKILDQKKVKKQEEETSASSSSSSCCCYFYQITCKKLSIRLVRGRARFGSCLVGNLYIVIAGGVVSKNEPNNNNLLNDNNNSSANATSSSMGEKEGDSGGDMFSSLDQSRIIEIASLTDILSSSNQTSTSTTPTFQQLSQTFLPVAMQFPTMVAHPNKNEFFILGENIHHQLKHTMQQTQSDQQQSKENSHNDLNSNENNNNNNPRSRSSSVSSNTSNSPGGTLPKSPKSPFSSDSETDSSNNDSCFTSSLVHGIINSLSSTNSNAIAVSVKKVSVTGQIPVSPIGMNMHAVVMQRGTTTGTGKVGESEGEGNVFLYCFGDGASQPSGSSSGILHRLLIS